MTETALPEGSYTDQNLVVIAYRNGIAERTDFLTHDVDRAALERRLHYFFVSSERADTVTVVYGPAQIAIVSTVEQAAGVVDMIFRALERQARRTEPPAVAAMREVIGTFNYDSGDSFVQVSVPKKRDMLLSCEDARRDLTRSVDQFMDAYAEQHERSPEAFPTDLSLSQWQAVYGAWAGVQAGSRLVLDCDSPETFETVRDLLETALGIYCDGSDEACFDNYAGLTNVSPMKGYTRIYDGDA